MIASGGGVDVESLATSMTSTKRYAEEYSRGGFSTREKRKLATRILTSRSESERLVAYATMDREDLKLVDSKISSGIEKTILKRAEEMDIDTSGVSTPKQYRELALFLAGKTVDGKQYATGGGVRDAVAQSQIELNTQMVESLRAVTDVLSRMEGYSNKKKEGLLGRLLN